MSSFSLMEVVEHSSAPVSPGVVLNWRFDLNIPIHWLQTHNEGLNQRYLKNWTDVADKIFGNGSEFSAVQWSLFPLWASVLRVPIHSFNFCLKMPVFNNEIDVFLPKRVFKKTFYLLFKLLSQWFQVYFMHTAAKLLLNERKIGDMGIACLVFLLI